MLGFDFGLRGRAFRRIPYPDSAEGLTQSRSARSPLGAKAAPHPFSAPAPASLAAVSTASERASPSSAFVRQGLCTAIMSNEALLPRRIVKETQRLLSEPGTRELS